MIPPIQIDLSDVAEEFALKAEQVDELGATMVNAITDRIFQNWMAAAKQGLNSTRKAYINALQMGSNGPHQKYIMLVGQFPNMIEHGAGAFDMKLAFAKSSKKTNKKDGGWFLTVPFRHATPGALGESEIFANVMPKEIYQVVKTLSPFRSQLGIGRTGDKVPENLGAKMIPKPFNVPLTRPAVTNYKTRSTYEEYTHKSSIYEGMVRNETTYENATQSTYITFRRVSDKSDLNSWIHRGINAHNFAQKALGRTDIGNIANRVTDAYLEQLEK